MTGAVAARPAGLRNPFVAFTPRRQNIVLALLTCALLPPILTRLMPHWFNGSLVLVLAVGASTVTAAIALNVLMGYTGQISLGHAALLGTGAFTSGLLTSKVGFPVPLGTIPGGQSMLIGIPAAALVGALVALLIGFPALRLRGLYLAIATIGFGYAMEQSIFRLQVFSRGSAGIELPRRVLGDRLLPLADFLGLALVVVAVLWLLDENLVRSKLGRAFNAIRENEAVAQSFAVDVTRYKLLAFVISGAIGGVSGALYGHALSFTNNEAFTFDQSLTLVIIVVVGGLGSRLAVVLAAIAFTFMPHLLNDFLGVQAAWSIVVGAL
ncbi:MAG: branched-chain amino acid ABC transporter permease, partial [Candidatus Dormibacteraeota bacterium]|nr:branched-chain amino acid ABC transporter permease [Candidatus Dormibacteraeota bacterium]